MDKVWFGILAGLAWVAGVLDVVFGTLHFFGPTFAVAVVALVTVLLQKLLTGLYRPPRYASLRKRYYELRALRDEAMKWKDREKAGRLARNIDQAELNQAYYNYFFEGLMINLLTKYMPFIAMLAYVNESYRAERLLELFDRPYLFAVGNVRCGAVLFFTVCVVVIHVIWFFTAPRIKARRNR